MLVQLTLPDGSSEIDGLVLVADVNEQFDLHIDQDTYTTVGGFVLGQLGRRPQLGDVVTVENRAMRVDALDGIRVARVWLSTPHNPPEAEEALDKIKVGQKIDFSGVADSYTKDPYMLTFKDPTIPGVQTTAPPRRGRRRK